MFALFIGSLRGGLGNWGTHSSSSVPQENLQTAGMTPGHLGFYCAGGDHLSWAEWPRSEACGPPLTESMHPYFTRRAPSGFEVNLRVFSWGKKRETSATNSCMLAVCLPVRISVPPHHIWLKTQLSEEQFSQGFVGNIYDFFKWCWPEEISYDCGQTHRFVDCGYRVYTLRWRPVSFHRILCRHFLPIYFKCFISHCSPLHFHFGL